MLKRNINITFCVIFSTILLFQTSAFESSYSQTVPEWVKNNAAWWAEGIISDKDFATGIGFMVKNNIIKVESVQFDSGGSMNISDDVKIPSWIKNNAKWWADDLITDDEFKSGIAFMIEEKIIDFTQKRTIDILNIESQSTSKKEYFNAKQIFDDCKEDAHCVVEALNFLSKSKPKDFIFDILFEIMNLYDTDPKIPCHEIAHHTGLWLYGYTLNLDEALQNANSNCVAGNYHGIFQNYFSFKVLKGDSPNDIKIIDLCNIIDEGSYTLNKAQCIHGMGHGLEILYKYDTVQAVQRCDEIKTTASQRNCFNGVFMENQLHFQSEKGDFDENDPHYPCNKVEPRHSNYCYVWQAAPLLTLSGLNINETFKKCDSISSEEGIEHCYFGIGRKLFNMQQQNIGLLCTSGERVEYYVSCLRGAIMTSSTKYLDTGFAICKNLPEQYKNECYDGVGFWIELRSVNETQKKEFCSNSEKEYFDACMNPDMTGISQV